MPKTRLALEEMQAIAKERGGRCLSKRYVNNATHLLWECAEGHRWRAQPHSVKGSRYARGTWCPDCAIERMKGHEPFEPLFIEEMEEIAKSRGGRCLSGNYINNKLPLHWECDKRHRWEATPDGVKSGTWCPVCAETLKRSLEEMQNLAAGRGGRCLSEEYINLHTPLRWECAEGHQWETPPAIVKGAHNKRGTWCPTCGDRTLSIGEMRALAAERGGRCLSRKYVNVFTTMRWECGKSHRWSATAANVRAGTWCPVCGKDVSRNTIEQMQSLAVERGGKCLSKKYVNAHAPLQWECAKGHRWRARPADVKGGDAWCPRCASKKYTLADMKALAEEHGGRCLSRRYVNKRTPMEWECSEGHRWEATPANVLRGHWCHTCGKRARRLTNIGEMKALAEERGGRCLSREYVNAETPIQWKCGKGHPFELRVAQVKDGGKWCPVCEKTQVLDAMKALAADRKGRCLSREYVDVDTPLQWECKKAHRWSSAPMDVRKGTWCRKCAGAARRLTIAEMQEIAKKRGGRCLSEEYLGANTPLKWECDRGHQWKTRPAQVKGTPNREGTWCPTCQLERKKARIASIAGAASAARWSKERAAAKRSIQSR